MQVLSFRHKNDSDILSAWAKHFRNQYCDDIEIDLLRKGTGLSRSEYLRKLKFPHKSSPPGPSLRAGDFGEILVADYLNFMLDYWVPRTRYNRKTVGDESTKGSDIIGFKQFNPSKDDPLDLLALFEAKAKFTGSSAKGRLQDAVKDSAKDELRKAESLNAIKQRFIDQRDLDKANRVERFQDPEDRPYKETYGAVALLSTTLFDPEDIAATEVSTHPHPDNLTLIVIHGPEMMELVHTLYRRAADEA